MTESARLAEEAVADVAERLAEYVVRYEAARDSRAVFAYLYLQLTRSLATALSVGDPVFRDPSWVADLAESLAGEYFAASDAMDAWAARTGTTPQTTVAPEELPHTVPEPWREVFAAISGGRSYVLEDALFSMMAHITYDLPVAMRRMAARSNVTSHIADFHLMNDVLGIAIDFVQDELASRYCWWLADLDRIFARNDELFSNYGIRVSRGMAWFNFSRLTDPAAADDAERSIRTSTGAFIQQVREPDWWALRVATRAGRLLVPERRRWPSASSTP
ncbi:hypothetical protein D0Z08_00930 [Nocardioides immobilis]|uniref:Uncharacterized protein n=1 Tax=Nocardioides immobilis TaxID=2049295 RepID=A0A417Y903_9ACTN|nr:DUF5995 family protein [Nocardioides immobilis]RHW29021.1 hypothetical protein D0Z08_00930 [Nocardioides immobilis]